MVEQEAKLKPKNILDYCNLLPEEVLLQLNHLNLPAVSANSREFLARRYLPRRKILSPNEFASEHPFCTDRYEYWDYCLRNSNLVAVQVNILKLPKQKMLLPYREKNFSEIDFTYLSTLPAIYKRKGEPTGLCILPSGEVMHLGYMFIGKDPQNNVYCAETQQLLGQVTRIATATGSQPVFAAIAVPGPQFDSAWFSQEQLDYLTTSNGV